jgi:DNA-binding NarL/FixJ family response regulator
VKAVRVIVRAVKMGNPAARSDLMRVRILVVDDHYLAREMIKTTLRFCRCAEPEIVGVAEDGATGIEMAWQLMPDVVTMDISLPDINGLEVTRRLTEGTPPFKVVVVTMHGGRKYKEAALKAGANHFIDKMYLIDELPKYLDGLAGKSAVCDAADG